MPYKDIRAAVQADIDSGAPMYILEESDSEFIVVDDRELMSRAIRYTSYERITLAWLRERILVTGSARRHGIDTGVLADYLCCVVPKGALQSLEHIVFISDTDADWDELFPLLEDLHGNPILEACDLPDGDLGIAWVNYQTAVIDLQAIEQAAAEVSEQAFLDEEEKEIGIATTVLHELFHLVQNDPYAPDALFRGLPDDPELQAEVWARRTWEKHQAPALCTSVTH